MSNDKEVIQRLLKIAEKQQKIITKLAQMEASPMSNGGSTWADVKDDVAAKLATIPGAKGYRVDSAELGTQSGTLRGKLVYPGNATNYYDVLAALKKALVGQALSSSDGKNVQVSTNPKDVSFIGMS